MQRQAELWATMQDSLDINFEPWDPAKIAQQWNARARAALGAWPWPCLSDVQSCMSPPDPDAFQQRCYHCIAHHCIWIS